MSELLTREKEFLKLNEELNVKTKILLEKPVPAKENRAIIQPIEDSSGIGASNTNNRLGKPPIKPRAPAKANTVPRNNRKLIPIVAPAVRSTPKCRGPGGGSATYRVIKEENNNENVIGDGNSQEDNLYENQQETAVELKSGSDPFSVYQVYANEHFEIIPSVDETSAVCSELDLQSTTESSLDSMRKESVRGTAISTGRRSISQQSIVSNSSGSSMPKKSLSSDGLIKYLKSKVTILENELEVNARELSKKSKELEKVVELQKRIETQRDQAISKNNNLTMQVGKFESKLEELEQKLKEREAEFTSTSREMESLKRQLRLLTQANTNLEKRLYRANEELENFKNTLTSMREADRELQETVRKDKDEHTRQMKTLRKQRTDLLSAYKKQLYLLDNLKRQTVCLEQARLISFAEKEFTKVLEWNAQN